MKFKNIIGIGACDPKGVMGKNGKLPWHSKEDLTHFENTTLDHPLIMGYRTYLSLPINYIKTRTLFVFTHQHLKRENPQVIFLHSLDEFFAIPVSFKDLYVVGGAEIYRLFFEKNLIQEFILTEFKQSYEGDTLFPLTFLKEWISQVIEDTEEFCIKRYFNPRSSGWSTTKIRGLD